MDMSVECIFCVVASFLRLSQLIEMKCNSNDVESAQSQFTQTKSLPVLGLCVHVTCSHVRKRTVGMGDRYDRSDLLAKREKTDLIGFSFRR